MKTNSSWIFLREKLLLVFNDILIVLAAVIPMHEPLMCNVHTATGFKGLPTCLLK